jgi:hypothetical protein
VKIQTVSWSACWNPFLLSSMDNNGWHSEIN